MIKFLCGVALLASLSGYGVAIAETQKEDSQTHQDKGKDKGIEEDIRKNFGAGIMAFGLRDSGRIKSARVINGIVRVEEQTNSQIGFMLEAHRLLYGSTIKHGPFVGIMMTGDSSIDTGILGWMFNFSPKDPFNVGLGVTMTPRGQSLGDGIDANTPLPPGETEVRYKYLTKYGVGLVVSFNF